MLPKQAIPFRFSRPALALILASGFLAVLLVAGTVRSLQREQVLFEESMLREGLTLIRSFGAGVRVTLRHRMADSGMVQTLVEETVQEQGVQYIRILREEGTVVAEAGNLPPLPAETELRKVLGSKVPLTRTLKERHVFEVSRSFKPIPPPHMFGRMRQLEHRHRLSEAFQKQPPRVIIVGLSTVEFDKARAEEKAHAWLMGAVLFLIGNAGLYFLFLYQSYRATKSTLVNMQLYTENVIESMPTGLISLDEEHRLVSINSMAKKLLAETNMAVEEFIGQCEMGGDEQEIQCISTLNEPIPVKISSSPLMNHTGESSGQVLILQDLRQIRKIEQQLELSRRLASLGKMAAGIAHEIRNPLGTLRGFAQYFGSTSLEGSDGQKYAALMVSEVDRLNESISTLLQFARAPEPHRQIVDVTELFEKIEQLFEADCTSAGVQLKKNMAPEVQLFADPDLLLQVLLNILQNAIYASLAGTAIELGIQQYGEGALLWVKDSGVGMGEEVQKQIFDPFFSTRKKGTGLGLAISHQIVEQHNGRIEVISSEGHGTTMNLYLPGKING